MACERSDGLWKKWWLVKEVMACDDSPVAMFQMEITMFWCSDHCESSTLLWMHSRFISSWAHIKGLVKYAEKCEQAVRGGRYGVVAQLGWAKTSERSFCNKQMVIVMVIMMMVSSMARRILITIMSWQGRKSKIVCDLCFGSISSRSLVWSTSSKRLANLESTKTHLCWSCKSRWKKSPHLEEYY